jgi:hypothetical protein
MLNPTTSAVAFPVMMEKLNTTEETVQLTETVSGNFIPKSRAKRGCVQSDTDFFFIELMI